MGKSQFVVYGSSDNSSGYQPFRDQDYQPSATDRNRAYQLLTLGAKYAYNFSDEVRFSVDEQHTDGRLDFASPNAGFYRDIKNLIDLATFDAGTDQDVFGNVPGTVHVRGGERTLDLAVAPTVSANASFTYNHAIDPSTNKQIERVPVNLLKVGVDVHPPSQP